jgi:hypothetical protein
MTFYKFAPEDIINTKLLTYPQVKTFLAGDQMTGSVYLERKFIDTALLNRRYQGYSERLGGFVDKAGPFSSSIDFVQAVLSGTNNQLYNTLIQLYDYYSLINSDYSLTYTGSAATNVRVITIPEIYYDREIASGSFSASDASGSGGRYLFDNGRGGIYSGSMTGTLVGNIFYAEGLVVLTAPYLGDFALSSSMTGNSKWNINFKGTHKIPVKIFRCRAAAGEINCSTNPTYYTINNNLSSSFRNEKKIVMPNNTTYITKVGLYDAEYKLVAVVSLAHPIRKDEHQDLQIRARFDF